MFDMDENFNFYEAVMRQNNQSCVAEQPDNSIEALLNQIDDQALADKIRTAIKEMQ